jgi:two-component system sensor histidine kinase CssS
LSLNFIIYTSIALLISLLASVFIARGLTRPLIKIQQHVKRIADRHWQEPLVIDQQDEFGQLADSIETMRLDLVKQDQIQTSMLQNISHELKTPIMVVRSYTHAIRDGIYPKGDLLSSLQVIDEEGERLEKLVDQLLYLTRMDYLENQTPGSKRIRLDQLIEDTAERLLPQKPEIMLSMDLQPLTIMGDEENWRVVIENLLENHLRHAASLLEISLREDGENRQIVLRFWNDGSKIEPGFANRMLKPFRKGRGGKFGLGLAIVQRMIAGYDGRLVVENEGNGVASKLFIPIKRTSNR